MAAAHPVTWTPTEVVDLMRQRGYMKDGERRAYKPGSEAVFTRFLSQTVGVPRLDRAWFEATDERMARIKAMAPNAVQDYARALAQGCRAVGLDEAAERVMAHPVFLEAAVERVRRQDAVRASDQPLLDEFGFGYRFLQWHQLCKKNGKPVGAFCDKALAALRVYDLAGNVRAADWPMTVVHETPLSEGNFVVVPLDDGAPVYEILRDYKNSHLHAEVRVDHTAEYSTYLRKSLQFFPRTQLGTKSDDFLQVVMAMGEYELRHCAASMSRDWASEFLARACLVARHSPEHRASIYTHSTLPATEAEQQAMLDQVPPKYQGQHDPKGVVRAPWVQLNGAGADFLKSQFPVRAWGSSLPVDQSAPTPPRSPTPPTSPTPPAPTTPTLMLPATAAVPSPMIVTPLPPPPTTAIAPTPIVVLSPPPPPTPAIAPSPVQMADASTQTERKRKIIELLPEDVGELHMADDMQDVYRILDNAKRRKLF